MPEGTGRLAAGFVRGFREDRPIIQGVFAIWIVMIALLAVQDVNGLRPGSYLSNLIIYAATSVFFLVPMGTVALFRARPDRPIRFLHQAFVSANVADRFMRGAPMLLTLIVFMPAFSAMKSAIPLFNPYSWDATFMAADRALHGGDPWRLLQPALGHPWVTAALAGVYHLWILLIYAGGVFFCFFVPDRTLRSRYFIAYFAIWTTIGIAMAIALSSVGPCFVAPILGDRYFDEQMAYLYWADDLAPNMVLGVQEQLLYWYMAGSHGLARGITAMPSMHVALALLFALAIGHHSKIAGRAFLAFFVLILIGSVHLAYHYAVDGYVSIIATIVIWQLAAVLARFMRDRSVAEPSGPAAAGAVI